MKCEIFYALTHALLLSCKRDTLSVDLLLSRRTSDVNVLNACSTRIAGALRVRYRSEQARLFFFPWQQVCVVIDSAVTGPGVRNIKLCRLQWVVVCPVPSKRSLYLSPTTRSGVSRDP